MRIHWRDSLEIVPLIQEDRRSLFVQGLLAGFRWDFPTALHLLIPQVENGLRKMLNDLGDQTGRQLPQPHRARPAFDEALRSETAFYLWWLLLRLIALPTAKMTAFIEVH